MVAARFSSFLVVVCLCVPGTEFYVSASGASGNRGNGSRERPAPDLVTLLPRLRPGDRILMSAGVYKPVRGGSGNVVITVPVSIVGGWDSTFTRRDPWGRLRTILSGDPYNPALPGAGVPRLMIDLSSYTSAAATAGVVQVDGLILDEAERNRYENSQRLVVQGRIDPGKPGRPSPEHGSLVVRVGAGSNIERIVLVNNIVLNSAAGDGVVRVDGRQNTNVIIRNNVIINNTGTAIHASGDGARFRIENNTVLFTWRYSRLDQGASGSAFQSDPGVYAHLRENVFGFSDRYAIHNAAGAKLRIEDNLIGGNAVADYLESDTKMRLNAMAAAAKYLEPLDPGKGNENAMVRIPLHDAEWAHGYEQHAMLLDRSRTEPRLKATDDWLEGVRSMLALPSVQRAPRKKVPGRLVWLHRMKVDSAIGAGGSRYLGKYGSSIPR